MTDDHPHLNPTDEFPDEEIARRMERGLRRRSSGPLLPPHGSVELNFLVIPDLPEEREKLLPRHHWITNAPWLLFS